MLVVESNELHPLPQQNNDTCCFGCGLEIVHCATPFCVSTPCTLCTVNCAAHRGVYPDLCAVNSSVCSIQTVRRAYHDLCILNSVPFCVLCTDCNFARCALWTARTVCQSYFCAVSCVTYIPRTVHDPINWELSVYCVYCVLCVLWVLGREKNAAHLCLQS